MVSLLLLKQMFNRRDERVVARWVENPCWQFLSGCEDFQWRLPCEPSDLVYFRQRIGDAGAQLLLVARAQLHGAAAQERTVVVDTKVQEKNITHLVDSKLHLCAIEHRGVLQGRTVRPRRPFQERHLGLVLFHAKPAAPCVLLCEWHVYSALRVGRMWQKRPQEYRFSSHRDTVFLLTAFPFAGNWPTDHKLRSQVNAGNPKSS
jgi:hypothetical protein